MTKNQSEETKAAVSATINPVGQKIAQIIDDPFASAIAATIATGLALGVVLSTMYLISLAVLLIPYSVDKPPLRDRRFAGVIASAYEPI